jgi:aspartyl-tRNA(Asn)/glutamyl-tRNA(Gln) amidotransferase subunit B
MATQKDYEIVVGLEVHAQLLTRSKLFCADSTTFGNEPNTQISVISLGYPGTLPRLNQEAILLAVKLGLACHCEIVQHNYFARKNYFYPDLPKGYQISQHTTPICRGGYIEIVSTAGVRPVRLNRIHIEEDAGKSLHDPNSNFSNIDFNRAGMPLLEIVTEPDLRSAEEAFAFVTTLRKLVRHLGVCDGNMEQGSLRCDVNISVRKQGDTKLGTKVEIKNLNSIRFIKKAIEYERERLIRLHQKGETILQQTRGFHEEDFTTYAIRTKEDEDDYRYFPEPDLPPFYITDTQLAQIRKEMPALPQEIKQKLIKEYQLSEYNANQIADDSDLTTLFLDIVKTTSNYKSAANWVIGPLKQHLAESEEQPADMMEFARAVASLIARIDKGQISYGMASQKILPAVYRNPLLDIDHYITANDLALQSSENDMDALIDAALDKHAQKITEYKKGKKGLISLFVGEVMKLSKGKADAKLVTEKIVEKLKA